MDMADHLFVNSNTAQQRMYCVSSATHMALQTHCKMHQSSGNVHAVTTEPDNFFLGVVNGTHVSDTALPWTTTTQLNGTQVRFHINTGAEESVITTVAYEMVSSPPLQQSVKTLTGPCNHNLPGDLMASCQRPLMNVEQSMPYMSSMAYQNAYWGNQP